MSKNGFIGLADRATFAVELYDKEVHLVFKQKDQEDAIQLYEKLLERMRSGEEFRLTLQAGKRVNMG